MTGSPGYCGGRVLDVVSFSGSEINDIMVQIWFFCEFGRPRSVFSACGGLTMKDFSQLTAFTHYHATSWFIVWPLLFGLRFQRVLVSRS